LQSTTLDTVAKSLEVAPMQIALAWLLQRSPNLLLIPGTSSVEHLRENLNAAKLRLSPETIATLDSIGGGARKASTANAPHAGSTSERAIR
jgi:aryl-alcohol dehydrogenase-like predicted oxidoreductase